MELWEDERVGIAGEHCMCQKHPETLGSPFLLKEKFSKLHFALVYASTKTTRNQFKREDGTSWSNIEEKPPCRG